VVRLQTGVENFIKFLQSTKRGSKSITHVKYIPPEEAVYQDFRSLLSEPVSLALRKSGIEKIYSHQAEAINLAGGGRNVLIATPTASGKTLVYNVSVFEAVLKDPSARALYIFPTKALAQDQLKTIREFAAHLGKGSISADIYDGDTTASSRAKIKRNPPNILLTNPDMLHLGILAYHSSWDKFFSSLEFVVLDELHTYRGIFGCHVSHIIRRLRRICRHYGSCPRFIASSATISNGKEFAKKLTGLDFDIIEKSGSPKGPVFFMFWNPGEYSPYGDAAFLLNESVTAGFKTIVFTQARKITELIHSRVVENNPALSGKLSSYRAGYLPEERREIEKKLFSDKLEGVIATSALELGVDIGGLDCCILAGYPGSVISTWQRGGRAGRGGRASLIVLVGLPDALDRYFMYHPGDFFSRGFESVTIDEHNYPVSCAHLPCAAAELPLVEKDREFYDGIEKVIPRLSMEGKLLCGEDGKRWFCPSRYPQRKVSIRSASKSYTIIDDERGAVMGDISSSRVFHECHPGAIYIHRGEEYKVIKLDTELRNVYVRKAFVDYYTQVTSVETITILNINSTKKLGSSLISWGEVEVKTQVVNYEKRRTANGGLISDHDLNMPPDVFTTTSVWMELCESSSHIPKLQ
jgi:DEAD/DEAH box helicase domain-containing protein